MKLYIGLISGTSMDGIDVALVDLNDNRFIAGMTYPYSNQANLALKKIFNEELHLGSYSQLNTLLGREFANAVIQLLNDNKIQASDIIAIGSHGQTICHNIEEDIPYTVQLGCAHTIAEMTGITVVADFRTRDLVLGGQGAPLAPIFHAALFPHSNDPLAVVNIGGIANLSYIKNKNDVMGYDIGPGNCLMDAWIKKHHDLAFDKNGQWAACGQIIDSLLDSLLSDQFFQRKPPKSLGKEYYSEAWLAHHLKPEYKPEDVQATLLQFSAITIATSIKDCTLPPLQVYLCGGGAHNNQLLIRIRQLLVNVSVQSTQSININPDFIEAQMFAWFAEKALAKVPIQLSQVTGAKRQAILGAIYPAACY